MSHDPQHRSQLKINWKAHEVICYQNCFTLSELCQCVDSCKAIFYASIGEIFLPISWVNLQETEAERMFISRRLHILGDKCLVDDLITSGCELCGTPVNAKLRSSVEQNKMPLYCRRSLDRLHVVGTIYRPFLLYVWDDTKYIPILVINKVAELLFGKIPAQKIYSSYKSLQQKQRFQNYSAFQKIHSSHATRIKMSDPQLSSTDKALEMKDIKPVDGNPNFYMIWLILLTMLFQHGNNSPLKFKVTVDTSRDWENGRLEMESVSISAFKGITSA